MELEPAGKDTAPERWPSALDKLANYGKIFLPRGKVAMEPER